jgi:hypothetical protein
MQKIKRTKKESTNAKFIKEGKDVSTKMEFTTIFTNFNVATYFLSSIICAYAMGCVCTLIQLNQTS